MKGTTSDIDDTLSRIKAARREASLAFLRSCFEGRPFEEFKTALPAELEATGQLDAAQVVRAFFHLPGVHDAGKAPGRIS